MAINTDTGFKMTIAMLCMKISILRTRRVHVASCPLDLLNTVLNVSTFKFMPFKYLCSLLKRNQRYKVNLYCPR